MFKEAPFDLMYGFRGVEHAVDLFSPFEMLRYWAMERLDPPNIGKATAWTPEKMCYAAWCKTHREKPQWEAGVHYVAVPGEGRILLPDLPALDGLRHCWCWQKRDRPYVPVWSYAKIPRVTTAPEENARLLCIYMRPWTLSCTDATAQTPLLSRLGVVALPVNELPAETNQAEKGDQAKSGSAQDTVGPSAHEERAYTKAWQTYIKGNVVSHTNKRFITNLLAATAARVVEDPDDSSGDSDDFHYDHHNRPAGSYTLIQQTLDGISALNPDNGVEAIGRHAAVIQLGRNLWQSPPLADHEKVAVAERIFEEKAWPPAAEVAKAANEMIKAQEDRPAPFEGRTSPFARYTVLQYGKALHEWFAKLATEKERPNHEQLSVLHAVRDRIVVEIELEKEGPGLHRRLKGGRSTDPREEPLRGCCHGFPGTGKSRVIKWLIRMFTEALEWTSGVEFQCVAFQNTVAHAMGGSTLHTSGDIAIGGAANARRLDHTDIDILCTRNQCLRWLLFDEVFMIPDE